MPLAYKASLEERGSCQRWLDQVQESQDQEDTGTQPNIKPTEHVPNGNSQQRTELENLISLIENSLFKFYFSKMKSYFLPNLLLSSDQQNLT